MISNNFHPNIKLTIEANLEKVLGSKIILNNEVIATIQVYQKGKRELYHGFLKFQRVTNQARFRELT